MIAASWNRVKLSLRASSRRQTFLFVGNLGPRNLWKSMKSHKVLRKPARQAARQPGSQVEPASQPATAQAPHPESMIAASQMRAVSPGQPASIESRNRAIESSNHRLLERSAAEAAACKLQKSHNLGNRKLSFRWKGGGRKSRRSV